MKILHSADWHLDAPLTGHTPENRAMLLSELMKIPEKICRLAGSNGCDLLLLSGDLFDGVCRRESRTAVRSALERLRIPVFIAPGNHDFCGPDSPYLTEEWPGNVHIFTQAALSSVSLPELNCRVYGAGYESMDCPGLLKGFQAQGPEKWHIGLLHGELSPASPYCPIKKEQLLRSGLHYLALGHLHRAGSLRAGDTLCAWPGCPMGHGFDELGPKGAILVELAEEVSARFLPIDTPRFYEESVEAGEDALTAVTGLLPAMETRDFYRVTLTGYSAPLDLPALRGRFPHIANLTLRDETLPEPDLWSPIGEDSLEGVYFAALKANADSDSETLSRRARLAARISRQILDGQEVKLP